MLHVCASAALYRPVDENDDAFLEEEAEEGHKSTEGGMRAVVSSAGGLDTGTTYVGSADVDPLDRKYIEHLFLEETMNRLNDNYNKNKINNGKNHLIYIFMSISKLAICFTVS